MNKTSGVIKKYLKEKNISQVLLAKLLDVSPQYINAILNDKKSLSNKIFEKIVKILKITESDKDLIIKYEYLKKNIKINESENTIKQYGIYEDEGFSIELNEKEISLLNFKLNKDMFYILINTDKLYGISKNHYLFFEKTLELKEAKVHLIELDNIIDLAYLEYIENKLFIKFLKENKKSLLINKSDFRRIKIIGLLIGKYITE